VLSPQEIEPELAGDLRLVRWRTARAEVTSAGRLLDYYRAERGGLLQRAEGVLYAARRA